MAPEVNLSWGLWHLSSFPVLTQHLVVAAILQVKVWPANKKVYWDQGRTARKLECLQKQCTVHETCWLTWNVLRFPVLVVAFTSFCLHKGQEIIFKQKEVLPQLNFVKLLKVYLCKNWHDVTFCVLMLYFAGALQQELLFLMPFDRKCFNIFRHPKTTWPGEPSRSICFMQKFFFFWTVLPLLLFWYRLDQPFII